MKKGWVKIVCIALVVVMLACLITSGLFYWRVKHSILEVIGIDYVFRVDKICMYQEGSQPIGYLNQRDRKKLFMILSHTRKYNKHKDQYYLLNGKFLYSPHISFESENLQVGQRGDTIRWDYFEGILVYDYPEQERGEEWKHSSEYYLEQKYAQELRVLFDKYSTSYRY